MDLKQAKIILEKINRLYQSMTLDEKIDRFEQELMRSYARQLYEAFLTEDSLTNQAPKVQMPTSQPAPPPAPEVKTPAPRVVETPPPPPVVEAPKPVVEAPRPVVEPPKPVVESPKPVVEVVKEVPAVAVKVEQPPVKVEAPKPAPQPKVKVDNGEHDALFAQEEVTDLSSKLGQRPVKDLSKAMGLNEKILTINELFGGDKQLFDDAIKTLNGFRTFEEAKVYLTNGIAAKYDWAAKGRSKKAKVFINLIRRRYN